jgi:hypothetical protein
VLLQATKLMRMNRDKLIADEAAAASKGARLDRNALWRLV